MSILDDLTVDQRRIIESVRHHAAEMLDHPLRFKYFTLHGSAHINGLFEIAEILLRSGLKLTREELFFLSLAIPLHDLGMVIPLRDVDFSQVFAGAPQAVDPANLELQIRDNHHNLISEQVASSFSFLTGLGLAPPDVGLLKDICRMHRKIPLSEQTGLVRRVGALLRLLDELDLSPDRAPSQVLLSNYQEFDSTSCWHWMKHNIVDRWRLEDNILRTEENGGICLDFRLRVRPPRQESIPYWLKQIHRPISKVLHDERVAQIIKDEWGVRVTVTMDHQYSKPNPLGEIWESIEKKALSGSRKAILVVDDEVRKMEDLFLSLMENYHVTFAPTAADALQKADAFPPDLAIVDMQLGAGRLWSAQETNNFKTTGIQLCREIASRYPHTRIGVLTGTRYAVDECASLSLVFLLRKPVDPELLENQVRHVLG